MQIRTFIFFLLFFPAIAGANELEDREKITYDVKSLFHFKDYAKLNKLGQSYLESKERTSSGKWKLSLYYAGLEEIPNSTISSPQYWISLKAKINEWIDIDKEISFPHIMYVETLINQAWMYRGDSWAHQVRKKDWEPFHKTIEEARVYLLEHESIKLKNPCWYTSMITIARAQSWDKKRFDTLIEEALTNHPSFYPIYFSAIEYLLPKWHGSTEEIEKFADFAVTKSSSVEGHGMYARIYWYASETQYGHKLFTSSKANWEKMKLGIHDVLDRYPDQWNINNFAVFSCIAGDKKTTRSLMGMIEGRPILGPWKNGSFFNSCAQWSGLNQSNRAGGGVTCPHCTQLTSPHRASR